MKKEKGIEEQIRDSKATYDPAPITQEQFMKVVAANWNASLRSARTVTATVGSIPAFLLFFDPTQERDSVIYMGSKCHDEIMETGLFNKDGTTNMKVYKELMLEHHPNL